MTDQDSGEYPLGHMYLPMTFDTPDHFRTKYLRFEVANLECAYNAIVGWLRPAKLLAITHFSYLVLKMTRSWGVLTDSLWGQTFECKLIVWGTKQIDCIYITFPSPISLVIINWL